MKTLPNTFLSFDLEDGKVGHYYSLPVLEKSGIGPISKLPVSIRIILESILRNCDGEKITPQNAVSLANWQPNAERTEEIPFVVARIVLQDFTGVPLLVDLAAMRDAVASLKHDPKLIEPLVPVDLVIDHSVQVDMAGNLEAFQFNLDLEFKRNRERYQFLKWGMQAFNAFNVVPPGIGIVHQVNLEYLAKGVLSKEFQISNLKSQIFYPDTLVGTDSHTTMINGLGVVGWGVGGIEAEAGMLGQPVYFLTPDVVGVHLTGALKEGVTATDLALTVTQLLRKTKVVGKFVEFFGPGAAALPVVDRATIANMAPEYGATMGFFPIDDECVKYLRLTGRSEEHCALYEKYYRLQGLWGMPQKGDITYSQVIELDLNTITSSVAGPKRPQDRINLGELKSTFTDLFHKPLAENGYAKPEAELTKRFSVKGQKLPTSVPLPDYGIRKTRVSESESEMRDQHPTPDHVNIIDPALSAEIGHGSVLIAAITSCTNTSNPSVILAAGLLAKKAVERGLKISSTVKTSLAPGSRVVTEYLNQTGLHSYLDQLGFTTVGYGCTTCIGNSGPLESHIEETVLKNDLVAASVLSGNRNFEARVHQSIKANFLMSPPLVVAFALAGRVNIDMANEPLGTDKNGKEVYLRDLWPTLQEVRGVMQSSLKPEIFKKMYHDFAHQNPKWNEIPAPQGALYQWDSQSTYIQNPPFFKNFSLKIDPIKEIHKARALGIFGDSITTDHISPAGAIKKNSDAGFYLQQKGVAVEDFNSYGSRRGNDRIMTRGTFANVRIKNRMLGGEEGGNTLFQPTGEKISIFEASLKYKKDQVPLIVIAGQEYGTGSSRDWAAKGTALLGVKAVLAQSYERIHRSNLVGMGVLPLQFQEGVDAQTLQLNGTEIYDILGLNSQLKPQQNLTLRLTRTNGKSEEISVKCRIDTPIEIDYYQHGGILPYVLRQLLTKG